MACCNGSGKSLRKQQVLKQPSGPKKVVVHHIKAQRITTQDVAKPSPVRRQKINRDKCAKCGYTIMHVNIAGRARKQCSNINCKHVL